MNTVASEVSQGSHMATGATTVVAEKPLRPAAASTADPLQAAEAPAATTDGSVSVSQPQQPVAPPAPHRNRKWVLLAGVVIALVVGGYFLVPWVDTVLNTVSTDDAYVNGHVTFVAPRVSGQVSKVLVNDNMRVKKGDLLVQLDKEPYKIAVDQKKAAVETATADVRVAADQARAMVALARSNRFKLQSMIDQVNNQIALLQSKAALLKSQQPVLTRTQAEYERVVEARKINEGAYSKEEQDRREQLFLTAKANIEQALADVYQVRAALGLPLKPVKVEELTHVPPDLDQNHPSVRQALAQLIQSAAPLGVLPISYSATPKQIIDDFYKRDPEGNLDRIYEQIIRQAPTIQLSKAKLQQAERDLELANLNLSYCNVVSEIDGLVTLRNVNPGNNVQAGQTLLAVRSLTEIWIDANFKETQLADLRIGQRVNVEVDMYGSRKEFAGRITGFTMGTGQTLALLPPQNATGNFVKIVQRLPVRIELTDYDPAVAPLFVGLSVTPYVYVREPPTGPHAGEILQPPAALPTSTSHRQR